MSVKQIVKKISRIDRNIPFSKTLPIPDPVMEQERKWAMEPESLAVEEVKETADVTEPEEAIVKPKNKRVKKTEKNDEQEGTNQGGDSEHGEYLGSN